MLSEEIVFVLELAHVDMGEIDALYFRVLEGVQQGANCVSEVVTTKVDTFQSGSVGRKHFSEMKRAFLICPAVNDAQMF